MSTTDQVRTMRQIKAQLRSAFDRVEFGTLDRDPDAVKRTIDQLLLVAAPIADRRPPPAFQDRGRKKTKEQLEAVAKAAEKLAMIVADLNGPAIDALADKGWLPGTWKLDCLVLADSARRADVGHLDEEAPAGRRPHNQTNFIVELVMKGFEQRTGFDPAETVEVRGLQPLIQGVFDILGIEGNPRAALRAAIEARANRPPAAPQGSNRAG